MIPSNTLDLMLEEHYDRYKITNKWLRRDYRQHLLCYHPPRPQYEGMWFDLCFHPYPVRWDDLPRFILARAADKGLLKDVLMHDSIDHVDGLR